MTGRVEYNPEKYKKNLDKAIKIADNSDVTNVLITGKGEPLDNPNDIEYLRQKMYNYPMEIQVDGQRYLKATKKEFDILEQFDVVALSFERIPEKLRKLTNNVIRLTLIITDYTNINSFRDGIRYCKENGIDQFSMRNPTIPSNTVDTKGSQITKRWIKKHTHLKRYDTFVKQFQKYKGHPSVNKLRDLNFGVSVYDVEGISFTHFDYCVQDQNGDDDIRSLIYMEDGHLYTSWSFKSSKLF
jgi:hypothetical protein